LSILSSRATLIQLPPQLATIPATITQLEIAALLSLRNRVQQLQEQIADAEASIQTRLESNAAVEAGLHIAELKESFRRSVAWRVVAERLADRLDGNGKGDGYCDRVLHSTNPALTVSLVLR
jgi:hypothetical protein